jgi:hypothetical protein
MPGDRENVVKLNADHRRVCKFGPSQEDQDNLKLVRVNIRDVYRKALKKRELLAPSLIVHEEGAETEDGLQERFARLQGNRT